MTNILIVIISIIFIVLLIGGLLYLFIGFMAMVFEAGFRDRFPYDYLMNLSWVIRQFQDHGYVLKQRLDAGTSYPGVLLQKDDSEGMIEVRLNAPLMSRKGYTIEVRSDQSKDNSLVMPCICSEDNKQLLASFIKQLKEDVEKKS